jgi:hypothetical protein
VLDSELSTINYSPVGEALPTTINYPPFTN